MVLGTWLGFRESAALVTTANMNDQIISFDQQPLPAWRPLNDGVMGGLSEGTIDWTSEGMLWEGKTRLENNGGFSSVRGPWSQLNYGELKQIVISCRGNGGPFKLTMERSQQWWMPYIYASFSPTQEWGEVTIPASELLWSQAFSGDYPNIPLMSALSNIQRVGLMKYDGSAQAFQLQVKDIRFE